MSAQLRRQLSMVMKRKAILLRNALTTKTKYAKYARHDKLPTAREAALCYIGNLSGSGHTLFDQQSDIVQILGELGYSVTLYGNNDIAYPRSRRPDLILGFGESWRALSRKYPTALHVLYCTEAPSFVTYINECAAHRRSDNAGFGRGKLRRSYRFYIDDDFSLADAIFQMGESNCELLRRIGTFSEEQISYIGTYGLGESTSKPKRRRTGNFLWFGSAGIRMKGLDVAISAAKTFPHSRLLVAGAPSREIASLNKIPPNVEIIGNVDVNTSHFDEISDDCGFCVFPTSAEGISTAVVTCAYRGLIPLVSPQANVMIDGAIEIRNDLRSTRIGMELALTMPDNVFFARSEAARLSALSVYSRNTFRITIRDAMLKLQNAFEL